MLTQARHQQILEEERKYWREIVRDLVDRIQYPEAKKVEVSPEPEAVPHLDLDDDQGMNEYRQGKFEQALAEYANGDRHS